MDINDKRYFDEREELKSNLPLVSISVPGTLDDEYKTKEWITLRLKEGLRKEELYYGVINEDPNRRLIDQSEKRKAISLFLHS